MTTTHFKSLLKTSSLMVACAAIILPASANSLMVYKTIGKFGEVKYSQFPPNDVDENNVEVIELRSNGHQIDTGLLSGKNNYAEAEEDVLRQQREIEQELKDNAERCQSLRNNLTNLNSGGRIYELDANGARKYINNREIELKRENYQKLINQYCTGAEI